MATQYYRDNTHPKGLCSPFRRRRFGLLIFILLGFFFYFVPWELPASLKGAGFSSLSRANVVKLIKSKKVEVGEIYGLLHIVTGDNEQEHILSNVHLDPTVSVEMSVYAAGDTSLDWEKERQTLDDNYPIVVFSKVYYFPPQLFANYRDLNIFTDILPVIMMSLFIVQKLIPIRQFIQLFIDCQTATGGIWHPATSEDYWSGHQRWTIWLCFQYYNWQLTFLLPRWWEYDQTHPNTVDTPLYVP